MKKGTFLRKFKIVFLGLFKNLLSKLFSPSQAVEKNRSKYIFPLLLIGFFAAIWLVNIISIHVYNKSFLFYSFLYVYSCLIFSFYLFASKISKRLDINTKIKSVIFLVSMIFTTFIVFDKNFLSFDSGIVSINYTNLFIVYSEFVFLVSLFFLYEIYFWYVEKTDISMSVLFSCVYLGGLYYLCFIFMPYVNTNNYKVLFYFVGINNIIFLYYWAYNLNLFNFRYILKKSTVYGSIVVIITSIFFSGIYVFEHVLQNLAGYNSIFARFVMSVLISIIFLPLKSKIELFFENKIFNADIDNFNVANKFSNKILTVLNLQNLVDIILDAMDSKWYMSFVALFLYDNKQKTYYLDASQTSSDELESPIILDEKSRVIKLMKESKGVLTKGNIFEYGINDSKLLDFIESHKLELFVPVFYSQKLVGIFVLSEKNDEQTYSQNEKKLLQVIANETALSISNAISYNELKNNYLGTVKALTNAIEAKDLYTCGHSERVVGYAVEIGKEIGLERHELDLLEFGGLLHDIGKIAVDSKVLHKESKLNKKEFDQIKEHPVLGENIIHPIKFLTSVKEIVRHHHEKWDGTGYPDNLSKESIPFFSRIIAIADAFDAMTSSRPYRGAQSFDKALYEIGKYSSLWFDPQIAYYASKALRKIVIC
ncbi:HD domain-containing phosphohydrolase [bacterium]